MNERLFHRAAGVSVCAFWVLASASGGVVSVAAGAGAGAGASGASVAAGAVTGATVGAVSGAEGGESWRAERDAGLLALMDEHLEAMLERYPLWVGEAIGDERFNDQLTDESPAAYAAWREACAARLERLEDLDRSGFSEEDHLDADMLAYQLRRTVEAGQFKPEQMPITGIRGPQYRGPQLASFMTLRTAQHHADYLARLEAYPTLIDQTIEQMRAGMEAGRLPPRIVVEPAVAQAREQASEEIRENPSRSPFYRPFVQRPDDPSAARAREVILERIVPAYERLADFLEEEYLPACRESIGAAQGVDGVEHYNFELAGHTTTELTAEQIHQIGLDEVARIREEMFAVIERSDFLDVRPGAETLEGDALFEAFTEYLRTDSRFYHETAEDLMNHYRVISKVVDGELPALFQTLPRTPYGVREIPRFAARTSPTAYYYRGSLRSGTAGFFMANTYRLDQRPKYEAIALTLHEAVPGHHLQIALAQELDDVHPLRSLTRYTAYTEGWALYAERLGLEMGDDREFGLYADPYDDFGRLNFEMWRAVRLVVDTGLHAKEWTRSMAVEYMEKNTALSRHNIEAEVDRYIGWPGQATAYKIGELRIRRMRADAEAALGDDFDIREFHDVVLNAGALPLDVLESRVERWVGE